MLPLIAVISVMACLVAKMFLAVQTKALEKKLERERESLRDARKELAKASGQMKLLDAEAHQLGIKKKKISDRVARFSKTLSGFTEAEKKEREMAEAQRKMIEKSKGN